MFLFSILLFLISDCLIRNDHKSSLKKLWIKLIPNPLLSKIENFFNKLQKKFTDKLYSKIGETPKKIDFNLPTIVEIVNIIEFKHWKLCFILSILFFSLWVLEFFT
jgi:hypothetical protein